MRDKAHVFVGICEEIAKDQKQELIDFQRASLTNETRSIEIAKMTGELVELSLDCRIEDNQYMQASDDTDLAQNRAIVAQIYNRCDELSKKLQASQDKQSVAQIKGTMVAYRKGFDNWVSQDAAQKKTHPQARNDCQRI